MSEPMVITARTLELVDFARKAVEQFNQNPDMRTYSDHNPPKHGELIGLRWSSPVGKRCISVLVFQLPYDAVIIGDLDK